MLKSFDNFPYSQRAVKYAYNVINGHVAACQTVIKSCNRFIEDLKKDESFPYEYNPVKAEEACIFIEKLPHIKGKWAAKRELIKLEDWQCFIVCNLIGWVDENDYRRFRKAYLKIPRKNGKSLLVAAIGHYFFSQDGEFGAEVYCGASTEKQAWEVFGPARLIAYRLPKYTKKFGIEVNAKNLNILSTGSKFVPLIGKPGDGASPSCAIVDEYHEHQTNDFVETMETGMGSREHPLLLMITTAGNDVASPCFDMESECKKLLNGVFDDEQIFALIYGIDENDDWTDPTILQKANPNYGVSISPEFLNAQLKEAIRSAGKQNAFKRKHLNIWVGAMDAWLNMETVNKCAEDLNINDFIGDHCIIPVDLASRVDIVATPRLFTREIEGKTHYYFFSRFYIPEETIFEPGNDHYQRWVNDGYLIATDGNEIDFNEIQTDIQYDMDTYGADEITYDPWRATQLAQGLQSQGANIIEFRNTVANMSPAMYELEAAITSSRFHYDGNPVMTWMLSNLVAKVDAKDNVFPRKQKPGNKIDGAIALIMGIGRSMVGQEKAMDISEFIDDPVSA